ncbi:uncharacterized protein LOC123718742 isoform X1 [Pieris brassicae]|uniref:uncharacterized protein LOC123718742 isoform X1 n=2 Tax=Pieris brassicae TaxID=7116 RepID=UPI001E6612EC|nr:uncharacterized protein LOC123718742 isoform X1 [Pieris brassicae]
MDSDGMVAVVRGLGNSGLTVTLLDGCRQYTLQPEATNETRQTSAQCHDAVRSDNCAQATDGRYASTYRMTHCHVNPTSPQIEVTEFPPQRAELCPGQGNFEIGGNGSGEKYHAKKSTTFRGGMSWPDKGSVFASRPSVQPDSFASSLRKYPSMSPERSSEILERLVSFAQNRSGIKSKSSSPTRTVESDSQNINLESRRKLVPDPEINLRRRPEESPTRDGRREESWRRNTFCRSHDIRYLREVTKAVREGIRSHNYPERLIPKRDTTPERKNTKTRNSVNMEIQAAVQMVSREVTTLPTKKPSQRNIAISQTPSKSDDPEGNQEYSKHIQTKPFNINRIKRSLSDEELRRDDFHKRIGYKKFKNYRPNLSNIFYTEVTKTIDEDFAEVLDDWLSIIPLKPIDYFGRQIDKEYIFYDLFERLKKTSSSLPDHNRREKIKNDVIELLNEYPVDFKGNKLTFFSKLADILIDKIKNLRRNVRSSLNSLYDFPIMKKRYIPPTESELRSFLVLEVETFVNRVGLMLGRYTLLALEEELLDILIVFMDNLHSSDDESFKQDVIATLVDHGFSELQATRFAQVLVRHLKETFINTEKTRPGLVVMPSLVTRNKTQSDSLEEYTKHLCEQINEWLTSIEAILPRINERGFRQVVVNDLAGDIIDRHKYLEMNPSTSENELEYLKYQIFKWINKLANEDTLRPSEHAPDLMRRIQNIPIPTSRFSHTQTNKSLACPEESCSMQTIEPYRNEINATRTNANIKTASIEAPHIPNNLMSKIDRINNDYEQFVREWVLKIPIQTSTPEEAALAEKARLGINNGLWKAITKLKCDPSIVGNRFYLEDLLDDEIEELLNCLPQSQELLSKKNLLKLELIDKTTETIERIRAETAKNYRQQLQHNVDFCLQEAGLSVGLDSSEMAREELEVMRIVELFILQTKFRDDDVAKSEVYRKRLLQQAKLLIDDIKRVHHGQTNINYAVIVSNIVNSLQQVPIPGDNTVNEEVDNILMESEVERWFNDLPIFRDFNNPVEKLQWKKQTDNLAKRIGEIRTTVSADMRENVLRNLISNFIDKTPIHRDEMFNKDFMVDELVNRIKKIDQSTLDDPGDFKEFCRSAPPSSSYDKFLRFEHEHLNDESVNYDAFTNRKPLSSSLRDSQNDSYREFAASRPKSSSLKEDKTIQNDQIPQINIQPATPDCCKGRAQSDKKSAEMGRQRNFLSSSRGIVFKEDNPSPGIKEDAKNENLIASECQTIYAKVASFEVGDVELSQDGRQRTVATNTKSGKRCINFDELQCRCIERFLRKRFRFEDLNDVSCFPFMFPCPCFY